MLNSRMKRVEELLQQELAQIIIYKLRDPRVRLVNVTQVKAARDLSEAVVYVSIMEDDAEKAAEIMQGIESARGYIKKLLAERIVLKRLPELRFRRDTSIVEGLRITELLRQIEKERG
jgi:ribosome-binding factor A